MDFNNNKPIYQQIIELICVKIMTNVWGVNERIPSVRDLASQIQVNPNTVMRAYAFLEDSGIIGNKRGIGFFVSEDGITKSKAYMYQQFVKIDLNKIFSVMDLLGISIDDIEKYYSKYKRIDLGGENEKND